ncbi:MAG: UDP-N-acetylglucosamine 2-epimerase (non-hydrolyzing) [Coleofasciculus sp. G1-WW12-02]|uniref:non-hydrolyzing UDP-N-acetylglucosamine 2-epimerase n=1 Tax=Coleofasciculus sp. G1-WW12-02 TaxID=3068483 RepID=UPI003304416F
MKILTIVGARPQFIKAAAVSRAIATHNQHHPNQHVHEVLVHTGQHYDWNMSKVFFEQMQIPQPDYHLDIGGLSHGAMTGRMLEKIEAVILSEKPDLVLVYGDTNSTLAGALAAVKLHVPVAHVEAGLRSYNKRMPEEVNRVLTDQISRWLFCPTETAVKNLEREGIPDQGQVIVNNVGDVMYDAVLYYQKIAQPTDAIASLINENESFYLATVHRAENTDDPVRLNHIMIVLLSNCLGVFTDSGGLQKEAYFFQKPCITLRDKTEWVELVNWGFNWLVGSDYDKILSAEKNISEHNPDYSICLYGSGNAGKKNSKTFHLELIGQLSMNIWLITIGEPLPNEGNTRLLRTGIIAKLLISQNHQVLWWTSTFNHTIKKTRYYQDTQIELAKKFKLYLLHSIAYPHNISIQRLINHYGIAQKFTRLAEFEQKPDIILCSLPTLELSLAASRYGRKNQIPVVLDVRDLWPDIFIKVAPSWTGGLAQVLLLPMFKTVRTACSQATAISGITPAFVDWGVRYAGRKRSDLDRDFPLAYSEVIPSQKAIVAAENFWQKQGISKNFHAFFICFFGTISHQFELRAVIEAAKKINYHHQGIRFVFCGVGDRLEFYKDLAKNCKNILFPGWVGSAEIWTLMRLSSIGIAPYHSSPDFQMSIPNKIIEYLSAGLPIISSLQGTVQKLLSEYNCGVTYSKENADELADTLLDLHDHPERLKTMSQNAQFLYNSKFVAEKVYSDMIDYLEAIATSHLT